MKACWYTLFQQDLPPECKFFCEVGNMWPTIDTEGHITRLEDTFTFCKQEALNYLRTVLTMRTVRNEYLVRDDYRELAETAMVLMGEKPPGDRMVWKKPGPRHKARYG